MRFPQSVAPASRSNGILVAALATMVVLTASPLSAAQFIAVDEDYVHANWYYHFSFPSQPGDWTSPDNYAEGTVHIRVEARSLDLPIYGWYETSSQLAPPDFTATYWSPQLCFFQDAHIPSKHACVTSTTIMFNAPGLYHGTRSMASMYQYDVIDWTRPLMNPMVIAKTQSPSGRSYGDQDVDMRYTAIVVAQGDTFDPPSWWYSSVADVPGTPEQPTLTWGTLKALFR
jgi:hypothetical protein